MSRRVVTVGGLAIAGGVGYYLYQAGGDPKVAQKQAEADASKLSHQVRDNVPGGAKRAQKDLELGAQQVGSKLDQAARDARAQADKADAKVNQYAKDAQKKFDSARQGTGSALTGAVDKFDKSVTEGASKTKSTLGSWFGGSK